MGETGPTALRTTAEPLLSPQLIAELTGLSYDTVRREILRGHLRGFRVGGKLRVRESDYER
jgi:excisionase family DNA binding protein